MKGGSGIEVAAESGGGRRSDGCLEEMGKSEILLPEMRLRVLLVEDDESTCEVINALLRKCNYRVAAVTDGLKAWEILRRKPHEIDLILTEVDLPSISGFDLLSLIMEHDICKNIPVIMMSLQDSVRTVYKCMQRGAADYLIKPLRKNELRNLWQHVWRRQSQSTIRGLQNESVAQEKLEVTSENNAATNDSTGFKARRNKECIDKGVDAQSSSTNPELEVESADMQILQEFLQLIQRSCPSDMKAQEHEVNAFDQKLIMHNYEADAYGSVVDACKIAYTRKESDLRSQRGDGDIASEGSDNNYAIANSSGEAIDLIGTFDSYPSCIYKNSYSHSETSKFDFSSPPLDLSLRRSHPSGLENQVTDGRHKLKHSNASAFTRYVNKPSQHLDQISASVHNQQKEYETMSKVVPVRVQVRDFKFNNLCTNDYESVRPQIFCIESGLSLLHSTCSASPQEPQGSPFKQSNFENTSEGRDDPLCKNANRTNQTKHKQECKLDSSEEQRHISQATDQSTSQLTSVGYESICGSNSNVDQVGVVRDGAESKNEDSPFLHNQNPLRSIQREVALSKFRSKRKDRCFEKKVRYESRKKLAEQRPRVKGQFVRQESTGPQPAET